jgi:hypothetical protein
MDIGKNWIIYILTAIFVVCYLLALFDVIQATPNDKIVGQLAPIVAVIIGYYFGRLPGAKNEATLKEQVDRKSKEADDAHAAKDEAMTAKTAALQKIHDAVVALSASAPAAPLEDLVATLSAGPQAPQEAGLRSATLSALKILQSS